MPVTKLRLEPPSGDPPANRESPVPGRITILALLWCALLVPNVAAAQSVSGGVSGSVVDQTRQVIQGATVTLVSEQTGAISLATEYLHVIPKTERAETDRRVTIKEARGIIESVGLELDNQKKTLKFKSRVNGTFEPQAIKK